MEVIALFVAEQMDIEQTDARRIEWQANRLSSAILMPRCTVKILLARHQNIGNPSWNSFASGILSDAFNVSTESAFYRLKDLGYINKDVSFSAII